MTFKMNFNSTVIWRQFLTVSLFLWLKMGLSHWQVMSKVYVSKLNFLSVLDNQFWCTVFASFLKVSPQFDVFSTVKISQCNTFHWKGLRHDESMVFHSCSSVEHWRVAVMFWKLVCQADFFLWPITVLPAVALSDGRNSIYFTGETEKKNNTV